MSFGSRLCTDVRLLPEVTAAQRQWTGVARRAVRAGAEPERVFALAHAVVARWWEQALNWIGRPSGRGACTRSRAVTPAGIWSGGGSWGGTRSSSPRSWPSPARCWTRPCAQLAWTDSGAGRPRPLPSDGMFCRRLGERVDRPWLGPLAAIDYGGPLTSWMGSVIRIRRGAGGPPGYGNAPWWLRQENQPSTMAGQLRVLGKEKKAPGSGTMWRSTVPAEQRAQITSLVDGAQEQLIQLRGAQTGSSADVAQHLLRILSHSAALLEKALQHTVVAAVNAGVPPRDVAPPPARWRTPTPPTPRHQPRPMTSTTPLTSQNTPRDH